MIATYQSIESTHGILFDKYCVSVLDINTSQFIGILKGNNTEWRPCKSTVHYIDQYIYL
jgi:hypothetical protein